MPNTTDLIPIDPNSSASRIGIRVPFVPWVLHRTATEFITFGDGELIRFADRASRARVFRGFHRTATKFITFGDPWVLHRTATEFITFGDGELIRFADRASRARVFRGFHRTATKFITFGDPWVSPHGYQIHHLR